MEIFVCYHCKPAWLAAFHFEFLPITFSIFAEIKSGIKFSEFRKKYRFDKMSNFLNLIQGEAAAKHNISVNVQRVAARGDASDSTQV